MWNKSMYRAIFSAIWINGVAKTETESLPLARIFTERGHRDLRVLNFYSPVDFGTMN